MSTGRLKWKPIAVAAMGIALVAAIWLTQSSGPGEGALEEAEMDGKSLSGAQAASPVPILIGSEVNPALQPLKKDDGEGLEPAPVSLDSLLAVARKELPRKSEVAREIRENPEAAKQLHHGPAPMILKYASVLGDLAERYEADPSSREEIDVFYKECALASETPDSIRALCYSNVMSHRPPRTEQEAEELQVPERVREIASRLPKRPVR